MGTWRDRPWPCRYGDGASFPGALRGAVAVRAARSDRAGDRCDRLAPKTTGCGKLANAPDSHGIVRAVGFCRNCCAFPRVSRVSARAQSGLEHVGTAAENRPCPSAATARAGNDDAIGLARFG